MSVRKTQNKRNFSFRFQNVDLDKTMENLDSKIRSILEAESVNEITSIVEMLDRTENSFSFYLDWFYIGFSRN